VRRLDIRARLARLLDVLTVHTLLRDDGVELADVVCSHTRGRGRESEQTSGNVLALVRRGCFRRSADGCEALLDATLAYCMRPGEEQRYDHPHDGGDACTSLTLDVELLSSLWGGEAELPRAPLPVTPEIDLRHRLLLAAARRGEDRHEIVERAVGLVAATLAQGDAARVGAGMPRARRARLTLVDGARELLTESTERSLPSLARELAVSPHHLSRVFREATGQTISRHRMRLRARSALERIAGGERNLARLAAELGFADHSHLCRVVDAETGMTPSALRQLLAA
jgi:AraC-like DNA-binding protein